MIWESTYWKELLWRQATDLERRTTQKRWPERSLARLEQTVMLGAYAIRKLLEAKKLTVDFTGQPVELLSYPWLGKAVTLLNWHHLDRLYGLGNPTPSRKSLLWLCNVLVHSYVFVPGFSKAGGLSDILFNSDRTRHEALYSIEAVDLRGLFAAVATDDANFAEVFRLDREVGDFEVRLRHLPDDSP